MNHVGSLHSQLMAWVHSVETTSGTASRSDVVEWILEGLHVTVELFLKSHGPISSPVSDEDVAAWRLEAGRWSRLLAFGLVDGNRVLGVLSVSILLNVYF